MAVNCRHRTLGSIDKARPWNSRVSCLVRATAKQQGTKASDRRTADLGCSEKNGARTMFAAASAALPEPTFQSVAHHRRCSHHICAQVVHKPRLVSQFIYLKFGGQFSRRPLIKKSSPTTADLANTLRAAVAQTQKSGRTGVNVLQRRHDA